MLTNTQSLIPGVYLTWDKGIHPGIPRARTGQGQPPRPPLTSSPAASLQRSGPPGALWNRQMRETGNYRVRNGATSARIHLGAQRGLQQRQVRSYFQLKPINTARAAPFPPGCCLRAAIEGWRFQRKPAPAPSCVGLEMDRLCCCSRPLMLPRGCSREVLITTFNWEAGLISTPAAGAWSGPTRRSTPGRTAPRQHRLWSRFPSRGASAL